MFKIYSISILAHFLSAFALALPLAHAQESALVTVDAVVQQQFTQTVPILGRLVAKRSGVVAARTSGPVGEIMVNAGDIVFKGQVLARLDTSNLQLGKQRAEYQLIEAEARLKTANAQLALAGQEVKRLEGLKGSAAISEAAYDDALQQQNIAYSRVTEAEAGISSSKASFEIAALAFSDATILAPFDGTITEKLTEIGNYLQISQPVFRLISDKHLELEADVPAGQLQGLPTGTTVEVSLENGSRHSAKVRAIIPEENARTRTRRVRFEPELGSDAGILANEQSATVFVPVSAVREILSVHKDGLIRRGDENIVFVVVKSDDPNAADSVESRELKTGNAVDNRVEVVSGLAEGDLVVIRGNERLAPGQAVRIAESQ